MTEIRRDALLDDLGVDAAELLATLERAFGVRPGAVRGGSVGALYTALVAACPPGTGPAYALAFHRLRRALLSHGMAGIVAPDRLSPDVPMAEIVERSGMSVPALRDNLGFETRLTMPPLEIGHLGTLGAVAVLAGLAGFFLAPFLAIPWHYPVVLGAAGIALLYADPRRFRQATLGDLARGVAVRNGADLDETALWRAFTGVIRGMPGFAARESSRALDPRTATRFNI